ncbi:hypothetical protein ABKV19_025266 [Rosa sericea]
MKITKHLEDRCYKDPRLEHVKFINIVAEAYKRLLWYCKDQMAYFALNVLNVVTELLDSSKRDALCIIGCQTLMRFIYLQTFSGSRLLPSLGLALEDLELRVFGCKKSI